MIVCRYSVELVCVVINVDLITLLVDVINICETCTVTAEYSGYIQSPGYPNGYSGGPACTLNLVVPANRTIVFRVYGEYNLPGTVKECNDLDILVLSTPSTLVYLCGSRDNLDILASLYSGDNQLSVALLFQSAGSSNKNKFQMVYYGKTFLNDYLVTLSHM